jgi:hypothetical protein
MKNTFLFRIYHEFKLLFVVAIVFIVVTLWFSLKSREEFPFLLFGMYSLKEEGQDEYISYSIVVDGKEMVYKNMNDAQHELVSTTLSNTISSNTNPLATVAFTNWLKSYTVQGKSMEIYKLTCLYSQEGKPLIKKRELIYPHDQF